MSDDIDDEDQAVPPASDTAQNMEQQIDTIILAEADNTTLVGNQTSNLPESYMSIKCVMDGGKQFNRIQSGSF